MMKTTLLVAAVVTAGVGLAAAPPAAAYGRHFIRTEITWAGSYCLDMEINNATSTGTFFTTKCNPVGMYVLTEDNVWDGDQIGVDPIMGDAGFIECRLYIDGHLDWMSHAYRGDGTDANCRRTMM